MKKIIVLALIFNSFSCVFGQQKANTYSKWYLKPAVGINIPFTKLLNGEITDNLFEYADNSYYWQIISGNYFFLQKWGVEFTYQGGNSHSISGRADRFNSEIVKQYGDTYFVSPSSGAQYDDNSIFSGNIQRGYLGLVYRFEKPNYIILPKLFIGVTSFYTDWGRANLKEKGTNSVYELTYDSGKRPKDQFTLAPSIVLGYRLSERLIANIDILYSYYKTDIEFVKETRNTFTDEKTFQTIDYKKNMHTLTIGFGLIIELKNVRVAADL